MAKKGQHASNAAAFIAILMIIIILYILMLPPDIRTELLGDKNSLISNGTSDNANTNVLLKQNVGRVNYINTNEKTYSIPATRISSPTSGQVIKSIPSMAVSHALFDKEKAQYDVTFTINKQGTSNVLLSFNVQDHNGPLSIVLNGREIFNGEITSANPKPIVLDKDYLTDSNTLSFIVPSPGWAFWSSNTYSLQNIQITGDVTDYSTSTATQNFVISQAEKDNINSISLYFYPNCDLKSAGPLEIDLNRRPIYTSVADCGTRSFAVLNKDDILVGGNSLTFSSSKGTYTLDNMYIKLDMKTPQYNTYYYDLKDEYFNSQNQQPTCGAYDGTCPAGCSSTVDPDCCFQSDGFWCALPTLNSNDRCVSYVSPNDCGICKTGYYDSSNDAPKNCIGFSGDNNDGNCTSDVLQPSRYYDKDCCFADNPDNFWCQEVPVTGLSDKCKASIDPNECNLCPSQYENKDGAHPDSCNNANTNTNLVSLDYQLQDTYELKLIVRFVDASARKKLDVNINGHTFRIDTSNIEFDKVINQYAKKGTNSIQLIPVDDNIDVAELRVEFRQI